MAFNNTFDRLRRFGTGEITVIGVVDQDDNTNQALGPGSEHRFDFFADDHLTGTLMLRAELVSDTFTLLSQGTTRLLGDATNPWNRTFTNAVRAGTGTALALERQDGTPWATLDSATGATIIGIRTRMQDDIVLQFGTSADVSLQWDTGQTNDALLLGTSGSNSVILTTTVNAGSNHGLAARAQPTIFIFSQTASPALQYAALYHDTSNAHFDSGAGGIRLDPANNIVEIRRDTAAVNTELRINNGSATGLSSVAFHESTFERAVIEYDNTNTQLTIRTILAAEIFLQTQSVTRLAIQSGGGINMGTSVLANAQGEVAMGLTGAQQLLYDPLGSTQGNLHMTSNGTVNAGNFGMNLLLRNASGGTAIQIVGTNFSTIEFGDIADDDIGRIFYTHADNSMHFEVNTAEFMSVTSTQRVTVTQELNVGTTTLATTQGSIAAGLTGAVQMHLNPVDGQFRLFNSSGQQSIRLYTIEFNATVFNDVGHDIDWRNEGDTLSHMLFMEANAASENMALLAAALPNWQSMDRGLFIGNATTVPTGNPTSGIFLYVESGELKARLPTGDIIEIAVAP